MALNHLLLSIITGIFFGSALPHLPGYSLYLVILLCALLLLLLYIHYDRKCPALFVIAGFGLGLGWACYYGDHLLAQRLPDAVAGEDFVVEGVVINLPENTERGERFDLRVQQVLRAPPAFDQTRSLQKLRLNSYQVSNKGEFIFQPGQRWRLCVRLKPPRGFVNPYGFDYEGWLLQEGYSATGYVRVSPDNHLAENQKINPGLLKIKTVFDHWGFMSLQWINEHIENPDRRALFAAIALGYKEEFTHAHWDLLKNTGTIHLVVVSGLNIVLAASVGYFALAFLSRLLFFPLRMWPAPVWSAIGAVICAIFYAGMTGFSLPTQRSLVMVLCGLMTFLLRQQVTVATGFLLALAAVLVIDPLAGFTASLWLSFGAVAVLLYRFSARVTLDKKFNIVDFIKQWITTQVVVSLGIFPFLAYWMGSVPLVMPLANLFAVPFATFVLLPLTILSGLAYAISPFAGELVLRVCGYGMDMFWSYLKTIEPLNSNWYMAMANPGRGDIPSWLALCLAILGVCILLVPRGVLPRFFGAILFLPLLLPSHHKIPSGAFELTVIDVGQGLSILVETRHGISVYDVGDRYSDQFDIGRDVVAQLVRRKGFDRVDTLVISHSDSDHAGGLPGLLHELSTARFLSGTPEIIQHRIDNLKDNKFNNIVQACVRGQQWQQDGVNFAVLSPEQNPASTKRNNQSCIIKISSAHASVLLTGDIERDREQGLLSLGEELKATVLVVPHHGSKSSSSAEFLNAVQPELALVSVGYKSQYGHPHAEVVQRYHELDIPFWRTDNSGALTFNSEAPNKIHASRFEGPGYWHRW